MTAILENMDTMANTQMHNHIMHRLIHWLRESVRVWSTLRSLRGDCERVRTPFLVGFARQVANLAIERA